MSAKPSYLGLLNAIAVGESRGHQLLSAWAETTSNDPLRRVLETIAVREAEHAAAFAKRICELGYQVRQKDDPDFADRLAVARSDLPDHKKFKKLLGIRRRKNAEDPFAKLFKDTSIDPITGALLGRFIAEERDSGRMLRQARDDLAAAGDSEPDPVLRDIAERIDRLSSTLEELKAIRRGT